VEAGGAHGGTRTLAAQPLVQPHHLAPRAADQTGRRHRIKSLAAGTAEHGEPFSPESLVRDCRTNPAAWRAELTAIAKCKVCPRFRPPAGSHNATPLISPESMMMSPATMAQLLHRDSSQARPPGGLAWPEAITKKYMQTQIEFRSLKFPPFEGEKAEINPGLWGKRLTEYLAQKLAVRGIETEEMAIEDWGCSLPIRNEGFRLALCCGHQNGDDDQFLVFTDPSTPKVKKFFRTIDATPQLARLLEAVRQILQSDSGIHDIVWCEAQ